MQIFLYNIDRWCFWNYPNLTDFDEAVAYNCYNIYKHGKFIYIFVLYFQAECRLLWQMLLIGQPAHGVTPGQQLMLESAVDSHST